MNRFPCAFTAAILFAALGLSAEDQLRSACTLLDPGQVSSAIGLPVVNVVERDRGAFTSCSFETDDWLQTVGLIHYPGLATTSAESLAAEIRADLERDAVEFVDFAVEEGFGAPAIYYRSPEGDLHALVLQPGGDRLVITGGSRDAVLTLAGAAAQALVE